MNTNMLRIAKFAGIFGMVGLFFLSLTMVDMSFAQQGSFGIETTGRGIAVSANELVANVKNMINFVLGVLGLIAVVMIIYAGIRLTSSAGNEDAQTAAKQIITYALIGLAIVAFSWVIVEFVTRALLSAETGALPQ